MTVLAPELRAIDHRLVWWLLANQVRTSRDVPTGTVRRGWRARAMDELEISKYALWRAERRLKAARIIEAKRFQRNMRLREDAFKLARSR